MKKVFLILLFAATQTLFSCSKNDSPSSSGSSGNDMPKYGDVTFWQNENSRIITVTFRGVDKQITKYYPDYNPSCGASGCANYTNVPVGNYTFHAENFWHSWNGDISVTEGNCSKMLLKFDKAKQKLNPNGNETMMMRANEEDVDYME